MNKRTALLVYKIWREGSNSIITIQYNVDISSVMNTCASMSCRCSAAKCKLLFDVQYILWYCGTHYFSCVGFSRQIDQQKAEKKHKHKKKKKHKKSGSDDDDDDILRQYMSIVNRKKSVEMPSQKQEHASSENMEHKLRKSSDRPVHAERQQPTSRSDTVADKPRHARRQLPNHSKHGDKRQQKTTHRDSSVDDSKRKHSRRPCDDFDQDKSTRHHSGRLQDDRGRDRTKNKQKQSTDGDGGNSSDRQNSCSKHRSKDLHRRRSSETEEEATESDRRARHRNSSGDERPDNSEGKIAGYGLIVSWKLFVLQP